MLKRLLLSATMLSAGIANATYVPVTLTGFNQDVIANGVGNASASTTSSCDLANWCLLAANFQATSASALPTSALPNSGTINSLSTSGLVFQLANYTGNNGLVLPATNSGTLTFPVPNALRGDVWVLGFTGNGPTTADITVRFTDNTTQVFSAISFADWYGGTGYAIRGIGRIDRVTNALDAQGNLIDPNLYEKRLQLSNTNYAKTIAAITVTKTNSTGVLNIVAATVCTVPTIGTQPGNKSVCKNGTIGFTTSSPNATSFQWQVNTGSGFVNVTNSTTYAGATTNNLVLTNVPAGFNNYRYRCALTSACGGVYTTDESLLTVTPEVAVTSYPTSISACKGASTQIKIKNDGTAVTYQWQISTSNTGGYVNIAPGYPFANEQTAVLDLLYAHDTLSAAQFRCIVTGGCNTVVSPDIPINLVPSPYFDRQPINDTVVPYIDASFTSNIFGNDYVVYWQSSSNGVDYVNINNNSLYAGAKALILSVRSPLPAMDGMKFRAIMKSTNPLCAELRDTSDIATLVMSFPNKVANVAKTTFNIYPNPVNDNTFYISTGNMTQGNMQLSVIDKLGRVVYERNFNTGTGPVQVNLPSGIPAGMYHIKLISGDVVETARIIKQ